MIGNRKPNCGHWFFVVAALPLILVIAGGCSKPLPSSAVAASQRAQAEYDQGNFSSAEQLIRQLIAQEGPNATLLYNLGCAAYRNGKLGEAVAAWESALLLKPRDSDILHNLAVAKVNQVDELPEIELSLAHRWWGAWVSWLSLDEWTLALYAAYVIVLLVGGFRLVVQRERVREHWATVMLAVALVLLGAATTFTGAWLDVHRFRAVIASDEVNVTSGPDGSGKTLATVHEGLVVELVGSAGEDRQIRLPTGWTGFVSETDLAIIGLMCWKSL